MQKSIKHSMILYHDMVLIEIYFELSCIPRIYFGTMLCTKNSTLELMTTPIMLHIDWFHAGICYCILRMKI